MPELRDFANILKSLLSITDKRVRDGMSILSNNTRAAMFRFLDIPCFRGESRIQARSAQIEDQRNGDHIVDPLLNLDYIYTSKASAEDLLKVGDVLWTRKHKPNFFGGPGRVVRKENAQVLGAT
jgi:hypothetical protein